MTTKTPPDPQSMFEYKQPQSAQKAGNAMEAMQEARLKQTALDYVSAVLAQRKPEQAFIPLLFAAAAVEPSLQTGLEQALKPLAISILVGAVYTPLVSVDAVSDTSFPFGKNQPTENLDSDPPAE